MSQFEFDSAAFERMFEPGGDLYFERGEASSDRIAAEQMIERVNTALLVAFNGRRYDLTASNLAYDSMAHNRVVHVDTQPRRSETLGSWSLRPFINIQAVVGQEVIPTEDGDFLMQTSESLYFLPSLRDQQSRYRPTVSIIQWLMRREEFVDDADFDCLELCRFATDDPAEVDRFLVMNLPYPGRLPQQWARRQEAGNFCGSALVDWHSLESIISIEQIPANGEQVQERNKAAFAMFAGHAAFLNHTHELNGRHR